VRRTRNLTYERHVVVGLKAGRLFELFLPNERGDAWKKESLDSKYRSALTQVLSDLTGLPTQIEQDQAGLLNLPSLVCKAIGTEFEHVVAVSTVWRLLYSAFYLLDKIEDQEIPDILSHYDIGMLINITTGLILQAELALANAVARMESSKERRSQYLTTFNHMALAVCAGQHQDLSSSIVTLDQAWEIAAGKSGAFFALGCRLGAYAGTESSEKVEIFTTYGYCLGLLVQISNDVEGLWGEYNDLSRGKVTLPVAYALEVLPFPEKNRLIRYLNSPNSNQESTIRELLLTNGAVVFMALEAEKIRLQGRKSLDSLSLNRDSKKQLERLLDQIACFSQI